jgi:hypothetical protein
LTRRIKFGFFLLALGSIALLGIGALVMVTDLALGAVLCVCGLLAAGSGFAVRARVFRKSPREE